MTSGLADLKSHGQMILANLDFISRLKTGAPKTAADRATFFGGAARGYIDYPTFATATSV